MPALKMVRGPEPGKIYDLTDDSITIGRGRRNEIIIHDNEISREHCRLVRVLYDYEIIDLESTNGTFVNGRRITNMGIPLGDTNIIELGDSITLEYVASDSIPDTPSLSEFDTMTKQFFLVIKQPNQDAPEVYELDRDEVTLGRHIENHIVLQAQEVSRFHLRLLSRNNSYTIEDAGATNGTHLNGNALAGTTLLQNGDYIVLGTVIEMWFTSDLEQLRLEPRHAPTRPLSLDNERTLTRATENLTERLLTKLNNGTGVTAQVIPNSVFVVYARSDWKGRTASLLNYLGRNNVPVWVDQSLKPDTPEWQESIDMALMTCVCLVVVLTEEALTTPYVQRSIRHFIAREKPVLVIRYEDVDLPLVAQDLPTIDYDVSNPERTYRAVLNALSKLDTHN